jgi:magnesium-transporting ATPase (P-type)
MKNEYFPADMILLSSPNNSGICYVETKNLDGETNLKHKISLPKVEQLLDSEYSVINLSGKVHFQEPNDQIYKFEGTLSLDAISNPMSAGIDNFLLRGTSLRNSDFIYGIVVYTGHETKIMKNSVKSRKKRSHLEVKTNYLILAVFLIMCLFCLFAALYSAFWDIHY